MNTGALILSIISSIFAIDAVVDLKFGSNATISGWMNKWLWNSWKAWVIYFGAFILLSLHFIFFN
jgi:hypothetical protein